MQEKAVGTDINQVQITSLSHIKGLTNIRELLRVNINSYFMSRIKEGENLTFGPVLLVGPSGTGKSLIAKAIHSELANLYLIETNGEFLNNNSELSLIVSFRPSASCGGV